MVSTRTQDKLALLFRNIAKAEKDIEITRQTLDRNSGFESYTAFKRIDRHDDDALSAAEITDFLKENYINVSEKGVRNLFYAYSSNGGTRISYNDFRKIVLSKQDLCLSYKCLARKVQAICTDEYLYDDVERVLARLIHQEIDLLLKLEDNKEDLSIRQDFGLVDAFNLIDVERKGAITFDDMHKFLNNNIASTKDDVDAIFARFNKNRSHQFSYSEFANIIQPTNPNYSVSLKSQTTWNSPSKNRKPEEIGNNYELTYSSPSRVKKFTDEDYGDYLRGSLRETARTNSQSFVNTPTSPLRESALKKSIFDSPSPKRETKVPEYTSPFSRYQPSTNYYSPSTYLRESITPVKEISVTSPKQERATAFSALKHNEKRDLARFLKDELDLDKNVDRFRKELALQRGFNSLAIFRVFDKEHKGYITRGQLEEGLQAINITPSRNELYLLMRRLDKNDDGLIRFDEFKEEIEPKDFNNKAVSDANPRDEEVSIGARTVLRKLFNKMISSETSIEELRKSLGKKENFTIFEAFTSLKQHALGWIKANTFKELLNDQGIYASDEDAELLLERYDRNKNGKVSYSEFVNEILEKVA